MTEEQTKKEKKPKHYCRPQRVFMASCLDPCQDEWVPQHVFMCKPDAIQYAYGKIQDSSRCNRPIEWWRVVEYDLQECEGKVAWGPHQITMGGACT